MRNPEIMECALLYQGENDPDRDVVVNFFGMQKPRWQIWDELHQHSFWTAGQVVANSTGLHLLESPGNDGQRLDAAASAVMAKRRPRCGLASSRRREKSNVHDRRPGRTETQA